MKRGLVALVGAGLLLATLPGAVAAGRVTKFTDHAVAADCGEPVDGGYISAHAEKSETFGSIAFLDAWFDPAIPFEDPSSATGFTEAVDAIEAGDNVAISTTWTLTDPDGNVLGDGSMTASLVKVGEPQVYPPSNDSNHHSATTITVQDLEGTGTFDILGTEYTLGCFGTITDVDAFEANPTAFVASNEGVQVDCFWQTDDSFASFFAFTDGVFVFSDASLYTPDTQLYSGDSITSLDATAVHATLAMFDANTGEPSDTTATADATLVAVGDPVTSFLIQSASLTKHIEQALAPDGSLDFSSGESFPLDADHCSAISFSNHSIGTQPKGPKPGSPPPNDTPEGAIPLDLGSKLNVQTTGTALAAEVGITTCPEGTRDDLGHTVWYTFEGTGDPVTVDTQGTNFDSVVAVYTRDGDGWTEVGCEDDVTLPSNALSYQAILTVPTDSGVTYYVQAGGFKWFFDPDHAQNGRLRLAIY